MPSLEAVPFARLILSLHREGFSGWLELRRGSLRRRLELGTGEPLRIESNLPRESLREHLARQRLLSPEQVARVSAELARTSDGELAALARLRLLSPRDLLLALAEHVRAGLVACVRWTDGSFSLEPRASGAETAPSRLPLDLVRVVCDAVAGAWGPEQTLLRLGERAMHHPAARPGAARRLAGHADASDVRALLQGLDGTRVAWQLLREVPGPRAHAALFCLDALHELSWTEEPATSSEEEQAEIEILVAQAEEMRRGPERASAAQQHQEESTRDVDALRVRILKIHGALADVEHYALLGVDRKANAAVIKRAYLALAKQLHPDAVARCGLHELKAQAHDVFAQISRAHEVLCDPEQRRSYDASLEGHSALDAQSLAQAEMLFRKGEVLLKAGQFQGALEYLEGAVRLWPGDASYQSALGWALFKKSPSDLARAREHLEQSIALDSRAAATYLRLHLVLKAAGDAEAAHAALARARTIAP